MSKEVARAEQSTLMRVEQPGVLEIIRELSVDPRCDPAKLRELMELQERAEAREAERAFTRDFALASAEMPRVSKLGVIDMGTKGKMKFARYEDIDSAIRPIELEYGFTRTFLTEPTPSGITMICKLSHRAGHSERSSRFMPPDTGAGRNNMQAIGSSSSYAKRYLTLDVWNIVTQGADDEARAAHAISDDRVQTINNMISECGFTVAQKTKFLEWAEARSVEDIQSGRYDRVMAFLRERLKRKETEK